MTGLLRKLRLRSLAQTLRGHRSVLGVDIGSAQLKVVELDLSGRQPIVARAISAPTPAGTVGDNVVETPEAIADALGSLLDGAGLQSRYAAVALPLHKVVSRRVELAARGRREVQQAIEREIENLDLAADVDWNIDWSRIETSADSRHQSVLLVAAPTALVRSYAACIRDADLVPVVLDVDAIVLEYLLRAQALPPQRVIAMIDVGASHCCVNIVRNGVSAFHGGLDCPREVPGSGAESWVVDVIEDIHHMLSFFWLGAGEDAVDEVWFSGGAAYRTEMRAQLEARLRATTKVVEVGEGRDRAVIGPEYAVAMALALRGSGIA